MIPKKEIIKQIDRLYNKLNELSEEIEKCKDRDDLKYYVGELSFKWFKLSEVAMKLDEFTEFEIKHNIDCLDD